MLDRYVLISHYELENGGILNLVCVNSLLQRLKCFNSVHIDFGQELRNTMYELKRLSLLLLYPIQHHFSEMKDVEQVICMHIASSMNCK